MNQDGVVVVVDRGPIQASEQVTSECEIVHKAETNIEKVSTQGEGSETIEKNQSEQKFILEVCEAEWQARLPSKSGQEQRTEEVEHQAHRCEDAVSGVVDSFDEKAEEPETVNVEKALEQHGNYVTTGPDASHEIVSSKNEDADCGQRQLQLSSPANSPPKELVIQSCHSISTPNALGFAMNEDQMQFCQDKSTNDDVQPNSKPETDIEDRVERDILDEGKAQKPNFIILPVTPQGNKLDDTDDVNQMETKLQHEAMNSEFTCEECGKLFTHLSSKKRHMLKHRDGEIPPVVYQCLACSKTFQYNSSLKRHLKLHSEEANGKAYTCQECSKGFMYATSLKRHLKTHSGKEIFPCRHCHRCFEYISSLKRHEKLHSEGKGFKCETCLKSFGYLSSLTRHQKTHQKGLSCEKCDKQFRFHKSFVKHLEEHDAANENLECTDKIVSQVNCFPEDSSMEVEKEDQYVPEVTDHAEVEMEVPEGKEDDNHEDVNYKGEIKEGTLHGDVIDLHTAENHPFVKFVVSQNTMNVEEIETYHAVQTDEGSVDTSNISAAPSNVAFAVVRSDNTAIMENCAMVNEDGNAYPEGIVFVELDQNNKVTEKHMEGLQASSLLQLLQAVEGFAVEQTVNLNNQQQEADENYVAVREIQQEKDKTKETEQE